MGYSELPFIASGWTRQLRCRLLSYQRTSLSDFRRRLGPTCDDVGLVVVFFLFLGCIDTRQVVNFPGVECRALSSGF